MTRLALALTVLAAGLVSVDYTDQPTVPSPAPSATKHRQPHLRASRSMRRHRLASKPHAPAKAITSEPRAGHPSVDPPSSDVPAPDGSLHWDALANCEASGNPRAVSMGRYFGLYQFDLSTWAAVGGTGNPVDASPAEQTARAQQLYDDRGTAPWPRCGYLLLSGGPA